jgi:hypothetical protein
MMTRNSFLFFHLVQNDLSPLSLVLFSHFGDSAFETRRINKRIPNTEICPLYHLILLLCSLDNIANEVRFEKERKSG